MKPTSKVLCVALAVSLCSTFARADEASDAKPKEPSKPKPQLLAVGEGTPDFDLPSPSGGRFTLHDALQGKKAVLVNFWFYH